MICNNKIKFYKFQKAVCRRGVHSSEIRDLLSMKCSSEILTIKFAILRINKATYAWVILYIKYSKF